MSSVIDRLQTTMTLMAAVRRSQRGTTRMRARRSHVCRVHDARARRLQIPAM
jgi:hypothetical protein